MPRSHVSGSLSMPSSANAAWRPRGLSNILTFEDVRRYISGTLLQPTCKWQQASSACRSSSDPRRSCYDRLGHPDFHIRSITPPRRNFQTTTGRTTRAAGNRIILRHSTDEDNGGITLALSAKSPDPKDERSQEMKAVVEVRNPVAYRTCS